ncbi:hypothetical protein EMCRGX_G005393, partial [Ephydatia muelleri]
QHHICIMATDGCRSNNVNSDHGDMQAEWKDPAQLEEKYYNPHSERGDPRMIRNWRPINLQNTIYKIYAALIARRMQEWAREVEAISPSQKGFLSCEGCLEHNFMLSSILQDSRRRRLPLSITWLDLSDAFSSLPHSTLFRMLELAGAHPNTIAIIQDIYTGSSYQVKTGTGITAWVPCNRGVKQGCPLSPILFNLAMEALVRAAKAAKWAGLTFNVRKCATLTLSRSGRQFAEQFSPKVGDEVVPCLKWGEHYKYLGCKVGANPKAELGAQGDRYTNDCRLICSSGLADWQKLDALHRFAKPALTFILQNTLPNKTWAQKIDKEVRLLRQLSNFQGEQQVPHEIDIARVTTAFKVLGTDEDPVVSTVARGLLEEVARKRTGGLIEMEKFLNSPRHQVKEERLISSLYGVR